MAFARHTLAVLCCPRCRGDLIYLEPEGASETAFLFCPRSQCRYRFADGVPVLLAEEAEELNELECARLLKKAKVAGLENPR